MDNTARQRSLTTNPDAAIEFLDKLRPGGPWLLVAIIPDAGPPQAMAASDASDVRLFFARHASHCNLYYSVNPTRTTMTKKAAKEDIAVIEYMHADLDPRDNETPEQAKARYLAKLAEGSEPPPTVIVDSGNGIQLLFKLAEPIVLSREDQAKIADVEARMEALMLRLGSKAGTQNIDRILRLPATINFPNKKKLRDGRVICETRLLAFNDATYSLDAFPLPVDTDNTADTADTDRTTDNDDAGHRAEHVDLEDVIRNGCYEHWNGDRSRAIWYVVCECVRRSWSDDAIRTTLLDRNNRISEHVYDQGKPEEYVKRQIKQARKQPPSGRGLTLQDFCAYMPMGNFIFAPTGELWPSGSVNTRLGAIPTKNSEPIPASVWLGKHHPVEQMTWVPGQPQLIRDRLISNGGWIKRQGVAIFNLYRPPTIRHGDPRKAGPWVDHVMMIYPDDGERFICFSAHCVQHPEVKINHSILMGGEPGIGKDTALEPVKRAVGPWNWADVSPSDVMGKFNPHVRSVVMRINEARDLGEFDRFKFYDHTKLLMAAPPDVLLVNEKHLRQYCVPNLCNVIITTNHKTDGLYLPADDRRHDVLWSDRTLTEFDTAYWDKLWHFYDFEGGDQHVAAFLANYDLSNFNPKAPPPKTAAFWEIVDANRAPEESELADVLDKLGNPDAVTVEEIRWTARGPIEEWLNDRKNRRAIPHRLERCGYIPIRNNMAKDGYWKIEGARQPVYTRKELSLKARFEAAQQLATKPRKRPPDPF